MGASDSIGRSITDFFAALTKEPAGEIGGMLADRVRYWRLKQVVGLKEKSEAFLQKRGITNRRAIPLKLTVAVIDGATIEDDDNLHTEWAKLLTNALDPQFSPEVRYAYTDILRALNPFDARLLHEVYEQTNDLAKSLNRTVETVEVDLSQVCRQFHSTREEVLLSADCLIRQRLIVQILIVREGSQIISHEDGETKWINPPPHVTGISEHRIKLTQLGIGFLQCCQ